MVEVKELGCVPEVFLGCHTIVRGCAKRYNHFSYTENQSNLPGSQVLQVLDWDFLDGARGLASTCRQFGHVRADLVVGQPALFTQLADEAEHFTHLVDSVFFIPLH